MRISFFLFIIFHFVACTSISYKAHSDIPVRISSLDGGKKGVIRFKQKYEQVLWGYFPKDSEVNISSMLDKYNVSEVGNIEIRHTMSFTDQLLMYISFGIYIPSTISYKVWAKYKQ